MSTLLNHYTPSRTLRSANQYLLQHPRVSTEFAKRSFSYLAPKIWNNIPVDIRLCSTYQPSNVISKRTSDWWRYVFGRRISYPVIKDFAVGGRGHVILSRPTENEMQRVVKPYMPVWCSCEPAPRVPAAVNSRRRDIPGKRRRCRGILWVGLSRQTKPRNNRCRRPFDLVMTCDVTGDLQVRLDSSRYTTVQSVVFDPSHRLTDSQFRLPRRKPNGMAKIN